MTQLMKTSAVSLVFLIAAGLLGLAVLAGVTQSGLSLTNPGADAPLVLTAVILMSVVGVCLVVLSLALIALRAVGLYFGVLTNREQVYADVYHRVTSELAWDEKLLRHAPPTASPSSHRPSRRLQAPASPQDKIVHVPFATLTSRRTSRKHR